MLKFKIAMKMQDWLHFVIHTLPTYVWTEHLLSNLGQITKCFLGMYFPSFLFPWGKRWKIKKKFPQENGKNTGNICPRFLIMQDQNWLLIVIMYFSENFYGNLGIQKKFFRQIDLFI